MKSILLSVIFLSSSLGHAFMMSPPQVPNRYLIGHEEITREGIDIANGLLGKGFYPMPKFMTPGAKSKNPLVRGNFLTDFPDYTFGGEADLRKFHSIGKEENWHTHPKTQSLHGLRDYDLISNAVASCRMIQKQIKKISVHVIELLINAKYVRAFNFLGHATHILQDTFSPAHVERGTEEDGINTRNMLNDICVYGKKKKKEAKALGACYHSTVDHKDYIWTSVPDRKTVDSLDPNGSNIGAMGQRGQDASYATGLYLKIMAQIALTISIKDKAARAIYIHSAMDALFERAPHFSSLWEDLFPVGILNCSQMVKNDSKERPVHNHPHF